MYNPANKTVLTISLSLSILLTPPSYAQKQKGKPAIMPAKVLAAKVTMQKLRAVVNVVGTAMPDREGAVSAEISGLVIKLDVREGDFVKQGQLICKLKDTALKLQYDQAKAELEGLQQYLDELLAGTRKEDIDRLKALVKEAQAVKEKWDREKKRIERLYKEKAASIKEYQDTISDWQSAVQKYYQMKAELAKAIAGPRKQTIARARAQVQAQQARVNQIKDQIDKTSIYAPYTGYVTAKKTEIGQWVTIGGSIVEMIAINTILARVDVPESAINYIRLNDKAEIWIDALNRKFTGRIAHIIPRGDPAARTFPVEIAIDNRSGQIKAGMFVRAKLPAGPMMNVMVVPRDAIIFKGPTRTIFVIRNNIAMPIMVETGLEYTEKVAVFGKLKPNELVVIRGNERLRPGQPIIILNTKQLGLKQTMPTIKGKFPQK